MKRKFGYTGYLWSAASILNRDKRQVKKLEGFENRISKMALSDSHGALITDEGEVYTWGDNSYGQLGIKGDETNRPKTVANPMLVSYFVENNIKAKDVVLGKDHTIVLDDKGRLFTWGRGIRSKVTGFSLLFSSTMALGHPKSKNISVPKPIAKLRNIPINQVSTGNHFAIAVDAKRELYVWGRGEFGVLGFENKEEKEPIINPYFSKIAENEPGLHIVKIDSCSDFSSVLLSNGTLLNFGNNDQGNMGIGITQNVDITDVIQIPQATKFENITDQKIIDMDLGECVSTFKTKDGKIYFAGLKVYFNPQLFDIDYNQHRVKNFCSSNRASAVVTEDNRLFYRGNFWSDSKLSENIDTGIAEADVQKAFEGQEIVSIGGKYGDRYALVKSK